MLLSKSYCERLGVCLQLSLVGFELVQQGVAGSSVCAIVHLVRANPSSPRRLEVPVAVVEKGSRGLSETDPVLASRGEEMLLDGLLR
jgi:hypothetical protein